MDGSRIREEKVADSKISGYVWTGPQTVSDCHFVVSSHIDHANKLRIWSPRVALKIRHGPKCVALV